jgi:hypothetical protein
MKVWGPLVLSLVVCGLVHAAPMMTESAGLSSTIETAGAGNRHQNEGVVDRTCPTTPNSGALPEPASVALMGIGLGLASLVRRKK